MADLLYTFHCARADRDPVCNAIRSVCTSPVHRCDEDVLGRDFGDAGAAEQVAGALKRTAVTVLADETLGASLVVAVQRARRTSPVRWLAIPVIQSGRIL